MTSHLLRFSLLLYPVVAGGRTLLVFAMLLAVLRRPAVSDRLLGPQTGGRAKIATLCQRRLEQWPVYPLISR